MRRRARPPARLLIALLVVAVPGCLMGSPLAAISGEPYGMVIDDVKAISGKNGRIWSGAPVAAVLDIPLAFVLDTAFLPISVIVWGIKALGGSSEPTSRRELEERRERRRQKVIDDRKAKADANADDETEAEADE